MISQKFVFIDSLDSLEMKKNIWKPTTENLIRSQSSLVKLISSPPHKISQIERKLLTIAHNTQYTKTLFESAVAKTAFDFNVETA